MKRIKLKIVVLLLVTAIGSYAQNAEDILKKVNDLYGSESSLQYQMRYNLYKNTSSKQVYESYQGVFKKNKNNQIYQKIDQTEFIWNNQTCLTVFNPEKTMVISLCAKISTDSFDLKTLSEYCKVTGITDKKTHWELELTSTPFSGLSYSKMILTIGKDYYIKRQLFYLNSMVDFSQELHKSDLHLPVLEIIHSGRSTQAPDEKFFDFKRYFTQTSQGFKPSTAYVGYEIEDQREITIK